MSELDVNQIINDERSFRVYVVMSLDQGHKQMAANSLAIGENSRALASIHADGCAQHLKLVDRVGKIETDSRTANRIVNLLHAAAGAMAGKGAALLGTLMTRG